MPDPKDKKGIGPTDVMLEALARTPMANNYSTNIKETIPKSTSIFDFMSGSMPTPGSPWQFQKDPVIRGADTARAYQDIIKARPGLGLGNVSEIDSGPTRASMEVTAYHPVGRTNNLTGYSEANNLKGVFDPADRRIGLNPTMSGDQVYNTLAHELLHSRGTMDENITSPFSENFLDLQKSGPSGLGYSVKKITELMKKK